MSLGSIGSLIGGLAGLTGSLVGASNQPNIGGAGGGRPFLYQPTGQPTQDTALQAIMKQMAPYASSLPGQVIPQLQSTTANIINNPYAQLQMQGATQASSLAPGIAGLQTGGANALYNAGNQTLNTAFDPQQALYNRMVQQLQDQFGASNAASGVSGPYAAGVTDQGLTNFNIDWQNAALQREIQGGAAAGKDFAGASDLASLAPQTLAQGASLPYNTYLGQQGANLTALNNLSSGVNAAFSPDQNLANLIQSYLGLGQSAGSGALAAQQQGFNQNAALGQGFASAIPQLSSSLSSLFAPSSSSSSGSGNLGAYAGMNPQSFFGPYGTGF